MENTLIKLRGGETHRYFTIAFQPNISLKIENIGDTPVINSQVTINGKAAWRDLDSLLAFIWQGAKTDREKVLHLWEFVRESVYHYDTIVSFGELVDPIKVFNIYGAALCGNVAVCGAVIYNHAGLKKDTDEPYIRTCHGHVMNDNILVDGQRVLMDIDQSAFYLNRDNTSLLSGDALARDHDLVRRELNFGPAFSGWIAGERVASVFGRDDYNTPYRRKAHWPRSIHSMDLVLRPGESIEYRWDNVGKFASDPRSAELVRLPFYANGSLKYIPSLTDHLCEWEGEEAGGVSVKPEGGVSGENSESHLLYPVNSPYAICGGKVYLDYSERTGRDTCRMDISLDGEIWKEVWTGEGGGAADITLDPYLETHELPVKYGYFLRIKLGSATPGGVELSRFEVETDLMMAPLSLPRLRLGENILSYDDNTDSKHSVRISHKWQECHDRTPPPYPELKMPKPDDIMTDSIPVFRWSSAKGAAAYHIRVSKDQDMSMPYRPNLDTIVCETEYGVPFTGIYNAGVPYHVSLRTCDKQGLWSDWSPPRRFQWKGPHPPADLTMQEDPQGSLTIGWKPNPSGTSAVRYDVYGSDEKGFSINKERHDVMGLGSQPSNFFLTTEETTCTVVSPDLEHPNANRTYYRIVAVDVNGTESGCSDYIEMPHPFVYSIPVRDSYVGQPYEYAPKFTRSIGDLQYRYDKKEVGFWEKEEALYSLGYAPSWLRFDNDGIIRGTPESADVGDHLVEYCIVLRCFGMHSRTNHYVSYVLNVQEP